MEINDLGTMNGWGGNYPQAYSEHVASIVAGGGCKGKSTEVKIGNCWYQTTCSNCGIRFDVDSSD